MLTVAVVKIQAAVKCEARVNGVLSNSFRAESSTPRRGRRNNTWEQQQATFEGNKLSYAKEGKGQTIQLTFGPHQTVKATLSGEKEGKEEKGAKEEGRAQEEKSAKMYSGVCIAGQDYFCLSLEGTGAGKDGKEPSKERAPDAGKGPTSGSFILILRRQRTGAKD